MLGLIGLIIAT